MAGVDFLATRVAEQTYVGGLTRELADKSRMLCVVASSGGDVAVLAHMAREAKARLTMIASDGRVLADSEANAAHMENHAERPM